IGVSSGFRSGPPPSSRTSSSTSAPASVGDEGVRSGIETAAMLGADPPALRVTWIRWDSGFRGTDLRIGDRIIAVNGERYRKPAKLQDLQRVVPRAIGGYAEDQGWKERGARDGTEVELTVERRAASGVGVETAKIRGKLLSERIHADGTRRRLGPGGPFMLDNDGFDGPWSGWYEKQVREWEKVLDRGWTQQQVQSRAALAQHLAEQRRIDVLVEKYPGPFARAAQADWTRVRDSLVGRAYQASDIDLAYRRLGERRAGDIAAAAKTGREALLAALKVDVIAAFPVVDPIRGD
ncbi:MAG TPA: hypothetical protein VK427_03975, partial [Kofleriaceae bacterium]|nr:hypothetical protein [Kofleriaceae bacterium]